jgi:hypothetical protein
MKNQNLFLTGILTIAISCPAFATGIGASDTTADCDNSTLGTYEGETNLQAQWTANRIYLNWYDDSAANNGSAINVTGTNAASCEYDGGITLPSNPSKTGYNFAGWRVRAAAAPAQCSLSGLDTSIKGGTRYYVRRNRDTGATECRHNASGSFVTVSCDDPLVSDLEMSEWKVDFSYGTVKGIGRCSKIGSEMSQRQTGNPTDDWMQDGARYCWCQVTNYTPDGGNMCNVSSSSWVFAYARARADYCARDCAPDCAFDVYNNVDFRRAVFGVTE